MTSPLFQVTVDVGEATLCTGEDLIDAWSHAVPDAAARSLDLNVGSTTKVFENPDVVVRRVR